MLANPQFLGKTKNGNLDDTLERLGRRAWEMKCADPEGTARRAIDEAWAGKPQKQAGCGITFRTVAGVSGNAVGKGAHVCTLCKRITCPFCLARRFQAAVEWTLEVILPLGSVHMMSGLDARGLESARRSLLRRARKDGVPFPGREKIACPDGTWLLVSGVPFPGSSRVGSAEAVVRAVEALQEMPAVKHSVHFLGAWRMPKKEKKYRAVPTDPTASPDELKARLESLGAKVTTPPSRTRVLFTFRFPATLSPEEVAARLEQFSRWGRAAPPPTTRPAEGATSPVCGP